MVERVRGHTEHRARWEEMVLVEVESPGKNFAGQVHWDRGAETHAFFDASTQVAVGGECETRDDGFKGCKGAADFGGQAA
jgi:hypothetical protein